jgi:hypothetical protein
MLFFQTLLFGGYLYAHLLQRWHWPRDQAMVHLLLTATTLALLPILPHPRWKPEGGELPVWQILGLLSATVGLPYFALAATSPLVQAWFSRAYPGRSPYRLYALSNFGSLAALLSYPFFFEWAFDLEVQSWLWSMGLVGYAVVCALATAAVWRLPPSTETPAGSFSTQSANQAPQSNSRALRPAEPDISSSHARPTWRRRGLWLLLPAFGSMMLLATTNYVCQDVAVVPLLWVAPLTLYLLSFIICFDHQRWYIRGLWGGLTMLAILALVGQQEYAWLGQSHDFVKMLVLCFTAMFGICMVCHGELVRLRPNPRHLTEYYLWIAAGGALGGLAVSLGAPAAVQLLTRLHLAVFVPGYLEWPLGLTVAFVLATVLVLWDTFPRRYRVFGLGLTAAAGILGLVSGIIFFPWNLDAPLERTRNFFGVVSVYESDADQPDEHDFVLRHGAIIHGRQYAAPEKRRWPTTYYGPQSGVGQALAYLNAQGRPVRVGVVGLGVGTLAAYARSGDTYRFYEINPEVQRLAEKYFTYLSDCVGKVEIVLGDARLSMEREPPQQYDLLAVDAFSGGSIPVHLLTTQAVDVYRRHLAADGVLALHITNSYLCLAPVARGLAEHHNLKTVRVYGDSDRASATYRCDWLLATNNESLLAAIPPKPPPETDDDFSVPLWTDRYSNLFQILQR